MISEHEMVQVREAVESVRLSRIRACVETWIGDMQGVHCDADGEYTSKTHVGPYIRRDQLRASIDQLMQKLWEET